MPDEPSSSGCDVRVDLTRVPKPSDRARVDNPLGEECYIGLPGRGPKILTRAEVENLADLADAFGNTSQRCSATERDLCATALAALDRAARWKAAAKRQRARARR